jgi:hypothetical protein
MMHGLSLQKFRFTVLLLLLISWFSGPGVLPVGAQTAAEAVKAAAATETAEAGEAAAPFPLGPVLAEAFYGSCRWRPDWPLELAPDAFSVKGKVSGLELELGRIEGITGPPEAPGAVEITGGAAPPNGTAFPGVVPDPGGESPDGPDSAPEDLMFRAAWDGEGRLSAFPAVLAGGSLAQVEVRYDTEGAVLELRVLSGEADPPLTVQFPVPYLPGGESGVVKVQLGERFYYVLFAGGGEGIGETWYDPWGNFAAYFKTRLEAPGRDLSQGSSPRRILGLEGEDFRQAYYYESGGNLSERAGDGGFFSALYGPQGRPLYWLRAPDPASSDSMEQYSLQWDQEGLLTRMLVSGPDLPPPPEVPEAGGPLPVDFRYTYEFDSGGNWIKRREIALYRRGDLLLPLYSRDTVRHISYAGEP